MAGREKPLPLPLPMNFFLIFRFNKPAFLGGGTSTCRVALYRDLGTNNSLEKQKYDEITQMKTVHNIFLR